MPSGAKLLIVDDDAVIRDAFSQYLLRLGYRVFQAGDGLEALEQFAAHRPEVVLSDIQMPAMAGIDLLRALHNLQPDLPVIMVSGTGDLKHVVEALQLGAWDFLTKPLYDLTLLQHAVERVLKQARLQQENRRYKEHLEDLVWQRTVDLSQTVTELEYTRTQVVMRLAKAAEYRDNDTGNHIIRVSLYAAELARHLGQTADFVDLIRLCSPMHDIGKIAIPDGVLLKPGKLDPAEWEIMKSHAALGAALLAPVSADQHFAQRQHALLGSKPVEAKESPMLAFAARIARSHHERWDGQGYPDGLAGTAIPLEARIVAVADIFDALGSKRPYKPAFSEAEVLANLKTLAGSHLQRELVEAFFDTLPALRQIKAEWDDPVPAGDHI